MTTHHQAQAAIDAVAGPRGYRCVPVSWEDASRGHGPGGLSCYGPNISDVRLYEKTGRLLYTCRSENWNERLGYVAAGDVALVTGNEKRSASALEPTTLKGYLQRFGTFAGYAGVTVPSLFEPTLDDIFSIRFQTVFLPVGDAVGLGHAFGAPPATEFCTEVYNYQTRGADNPRNVLLLATPQGMSVQEDVPGRGRLYYHSVDSAGTVHRYWLEAEKSDKEVGGAQVETVAEARAAAARGKATAVRIGPASMGTRFNVQMLIQVPIQQQCRGTGGFAGCNPFGAAPVSGSTGFGGGGRGGRGGFGGAPTAAFGMSSVAGGFGMRASAPILGVSNAARVSRGSEQDTYAGVANKAPQRDPTQHGTITVSIYYTVVGGVPSPADVAKAIDDLDALYKACPSDKRLAQCHEVTDPTWSAPKSVAILPPPPAPSAVVNPFGPTPTPTGLRCQNGHSMMAIVGGNAIEPSAGWFCDSCGTWSPAGAGAPFPTGVKGYGCRRCDFDVCARCASGSKCKHQHPLVNITQSTLGGAAYVQCTGCGKQLATHVAPLRGCLCTSPPTIHCLHCTLREGTPSNNF